MDNIITDYESERSLIIKKNNIRYLANEFAKQDIARVSLLRANGEKVEYSPNIRMLEMVY